MDGIELLRNDHQKILAIINELITGGANNMTQKSDTAKGIIRQRQTLYHKLRELLVRHLAVEEEVYRDLLASVRWRKFAAASDRPQRLLWASTGTKDPDAPDTLYIEALAAPDTINTVPEKTLRAFADHGQVKRPLPADGGDSDQVLAEFTQAGVDHAALASQLQREGTNAFDKSWEDLMDCIAAKSASLKKS